MSVDRKLIPSPSNSRFDGVKIADRKLFGSGQRRRRRRLKWALRSERTSSGQFNKTLSAPISLQRYAAAELGRLWLFRGVVEFGNHAKFWNFYCPSDEMFDKKGTHCCSPHWMCVDQASRSLQEFHGSVTHPPQGCAFLSLRSKVILFVSVMRFSIVRSIVIECCSCAFGCAILFSNRVEQLRDILERVWMGPEDVVGQNTRKK